MSTMTDKQRVLSEQRGGFEREAVAVYSRLQAAMRNFVKATPGLTRRPTDLARTLKLHAKLAWQVHKIAHADDPLAEAGHVPGPAAVRRLINAAIERGTPSEHVSALESAHEDLQRLIELHARSRAEFDSMVSALADDSAEQINITHRRAAFKAQSHILGVQAKTHVALFIHAPSADDDGLIDNVGIRGMIGLRRFRREASWVISQTRNADDDMIVRHPIVREPLDDSAEVPDEASLLTKFCSKPLPKVRLVRASNDMTNVSIEGESVGNASAMNCIVGDVYRKGCVRYRDEHNTVHSTTARVRTPCEVLLHDMLIHEDLFGDAQPTLKVFSDHRESDSLLPGREADMLSIAEMPLYLGKGPASLDSPDVPRYTEMAQYALDRLGWDPSRFRAYRCRIEFPVMPSSVQVEFELPQRPK